MLVYNKQGKVIIREIYHHQNYKPLISNQNFLSVSVKYCIYSETCCYSEKLVCLTVFLADWPIKGIEDGYVVIK
jgi:hypothetical protein